MCDKWLEARSSLELSRYPAKLLFSVRCEKAPDVQLALNPTVAYRMSAFARKFMRRLGFPPFSECHCETRALVYAY